MNRIGVWMGLFLPAMVCAESSCHPESVQASTPSDQFIDHHNGTVTDKTTGLMWKKCSEGLTGETCQKGNIDRYTWPQASWHVEEELNSHGGFAGFHDWRLPTLKELTAITERQCTSPAINATIFPNTSSGYYWTSSSVLFSRGIVWDVNFGNGFTASHKEGALHFIRLVRKP